VIHAVIADDQDAVRAGFAALLETQPDITVVATAADGKEAIAHTTQHHPDVVLMDIRMPVLDGIAATRQICDTRNDAGPRVLVLTTFDLDEYVYDALQAGASGFLLKDVTPETLFEAVRVVAAGNALLAPTVTRRLIAEFARLRPQPRTHPNDLDALTGRELEILNLVAAGLSNQEIADRLVLSNETVKTHVSHILRKLGLRDRAQAAQTSHFDGKEGVDGSSPSRASRKSLQIARFPFQSLNTCHVRAIAGATWCPLAWTHQDLELACPSGSEPV
jgi:DNA-binding NarL/FixJ family response regulator